ncbi:aminopeptidase RNPEPL1 isoform X1 [Rhinopithecus roxellana]|uniref:aminopeptidase RNPEPL1 isoform X1 n=1 Tax=Rhinopithecus roxellana TaxID=61622 RepID=UPI0012370E57|nr:aminopeptidase RNPEPL1 isoform X1 [Rhinopithecus roxellana]
MTLSSPRCAPPQHKPHLEAACPGGPKVPRSLQRLSPGPGRQCLGGSSDPASWDLPGAAWGGSEGLRVLLSRSARLGSQHSAPAPRRARFPGSPRPWLPALPARRPGPAPRPRAQRPRRRPSGARAGRRTARGRAGRLPARLPVVPAPRRRRPAPLARCPRPGAAAAHGFHLVPAAMAAQCCCRQAPGAETAPVRPPPEPPPALDVASASSAQLFRLRHLQLGLELRPEARELAGCLVLELCALRPAPRALVLDAHPALRLHSAAFRRAPAAAETPCAFAFSAPGPGPAPPPPLPAFPEAPGAEPACCPLAFRVDPFTDYGSSLTVTLPPELQEHQPFQVILRYTSTDAPAIWWLDPELTYGCAKPFVFTQGHSVCNRSFFPCFDTPAVKCTYSAVVKAPSGVQVLMSATQSAYMEEEGVFHFHMEHPVPAYLVALVAGDLKPADIGPRSRVWAEPCLLPTATSKLSGAVEQWLSAAERLYGPYMWGRYDIVFLPPSFPIVAMENPCLTFIISSILESDEFLVIDVIHEVAHSWFGNAVTNATWEEMWLSEGLATYAQRRITTETYGAAFTCLETAFRLDALHRQMKLLGEDSPVSKLQVKLEPGVNPSHLMNLFTYEKGYCFVYYLSQLCGDPQRFDDFLRAYVEKYKFTSVVAQDLLDSFLSFFPELKEQSVDCRAGLEFERWLNATGPPLAEPDLSQGSSLTRPVEALFQLWTAEPLDQAAASASAIDISKWRTFQTALFLDRLLDGSPLPQEVVMSLSKCYSSLLDSMNAEIRIRWLQIVVRNDYYPDLHRVRRFLESQMSRMYTIPLYEDLCTGALKSFALEVFYQTQGRLHPNLRRAIQQILSQGLGSSTEPASEPSTELGRAEADTDSDAQALLLGDEAPSSAISLRDVNVSA